MSLHAPAQLTLTPDAAAVSQARAFVAEQCRRRGLDVDTCDSAVLLTSETVTNAFTHGRSEARIAVITAPDLTAAPGDASGAVADTRASTPPAGRPADRRAGAGAGGRDAASPSRPRLRVEVADDNSRHPQTVPQDDDALDGRGLAILDMLSARWGVRDEPYGKTVWFEL